ncbi:MAG TPA: hypothetical protein VM939_06685 [Gemmatimonadaceae bacterium]|nr:hypothetical protein [Gemmatimonadaceae bacterium]
MHRAAGVVLGLVLLSSPRLFSQTTPAPITSQPSLDVLLNEAAIVNARIPEQLRAYRARVETEMSLALIDSAGRERTTQLEQIASDVRFRTPDRYDQRVVGYRNQFVGPTFSLMSIFGGWTTPTLYGNRLQLGVTSANSSNRTISESARALAIHPLSMNRGAYYRYEGGDTAVTLFSTSGRRIPLVRVRVSPNPNAQGDAILFFGDMYLDADRKQIVRMRGRMVELEDGKVTIKSGSRLPGVSGASFTELVNVEVNGEYWLPAYQRTELQARISLFGEFRSIVRIVSRFHDIRANDSSWSGPATPPGIRHQLSFASAADLQRFNAWQRPIGAASTDTYYAEFDDLAPEAWRTVGEATLRFRPRSLGEVFRFNRIEGVFTGIAAQQDFRDAAPGLSIRGSAGYAWSEGAVRGMAGAQRTLGKTTTGVRVERSLVHTNDFQQPLTWGATLSALLGSIDDFDYLDRRSATLSIARALGLQRRSLVTFEAGPASDNPVKQNISRGLYEGNGDGFRPNRGIREGNYFRTAGTLELNPHVSGLFVDRGLGLTVHYERADGDVKWQRLDLRTAGRRELGPFQIYARGDAGTLLGTPAPQVMFELGSEQGLSSYDYKEFAGDRAAIVRTVVGYTFPFLRAPIRLPSRLIFPGLAPGIAAGIHGGWTEISGAAAQQALLELGSITDSATSVTVPISRPTGGMRASAELLLTFFSGAVALGVTRPVDQAGSWKFTGRIGQGF